MTEMPGKLSLVPWEPPAPEDKQDQKAADDFLPKFADGFLRYVCLQYLERASGQNAEEELPLGTLDDIINAIKAAGAAGAGGGGS